jgi:hypothetical protein
MGWDAQERRLWSTWADRLGSLRVLAQAAIYEGLALDPRPLLQEFSRGSQLCDVRARYKLARDYPSTATSYSAMRAEFARSNGFGKQRGKAAAQTAQVAEAVTEALKAHGREDCEADQGSQSEEGCGRRVASCGHGAPGRSGDRGPVCVCGQPPRHSSRTHYGRALGR